MSDIENEWKVIAFTNCGLWASLHNGKGHRNYASSIALWTGLSKSLVFKGLRYSELVLKKLHSQPFMVRVQLRDALFFHIYMNNIKSNI